jgi:radical SAM protein with 4Fe4S-binding SPASM domain
MSCNTLICSGKGIEARAEKGLSTEELKGVLKEACGLAEELGVNLQWYSPTCYNHLNPIQLGLGAKSCSAASYNMLIQPDGSVLPCQSWPEGVGNILQDAWEDIWSHPTCAKLREHGFAKEREECIVCLYNDVCGGGCPLEHKDPTKEDSR